MGVWKRSHSIKLEARQEQMLARLMASQKYPTTESAVVRTLIENEYAATFGNMSIRERESNPKSDARQELQSSECVPVSHTPVIVQNPNPSVRGKRTA